MLTGRLLSAYSRRPRAARTPRVVLAGLPPKPEPVPANGEFECTLLFAKMRKTIWTDAGAGIPDAWEGCTSETASAMLLLNLMYRRQDHPPTQCGYTLYPSDYGF